MDERAETRPLKILDAALRWCAPHLIEAIKQEERLFARRDLKGINLPVLSGSEDLMKPGSGTWMMGTRDYEPLMEAWSDLQRDLIARIEDGVCHVEAVLSGETGDSHLSALSDCSHLTCTSTFSATP